MNYRGKLDTYGFSLFSLTRSSSFATLGADKRLSTFSSGMSQWGCSEEIQSVAFFLLTPFLTIPNSFCILGIEIANSLPGCSLHFLKRAPGERSLLFLFLLPPPSLLYHANRKSYKKMDRAMHKAVVRAERRMRNYKSGCLEGRIGVYGASSSPHGKTCQSDTEILIKPKPRR